MWTDTQEGYTQEELQKIVDQICCQPSSPDSVLELNGEPAAIPPADGIPSDGPSGARKQLEFDLRCHEELDSAFEVSNEDLIHWVDSTPPAASNTGNPRDMNAFRVSVYLGVTTEVVATCMNNFEVSLMPWLVLQQLAKSIFPKNFEAAYHGNGKLPPTSGLHAVQADMLVVNKSVMASEFTADLFKWRGDGGLDQIFRNVNSGYETIFMNLYVNFVAHELQQRVDALFVYYECIVCVHCNYNNYPIAQLFVNWPSYMKAYVSNVMSIAVQDLHKNSVVYIATSLVLKDSSHNGVETNSFPFRTEPTLHVGETCLTRKVFVAPEMPFTLVSNKHNVNCTSYGVYIKNVGMAYQLFQVSEEEAVGDVSNWLVVYDFMNNCDRPFDQLPPHVKSQIMESVKCGLFNAVIHHPIFTTGFVVLVANRKIFPGEVLTVYNAEANMSCYGKWAEKPPTTGAMRPNFVKRTFDYMEDGKQLSMEVDVPSQRKSKRIPYNVPRLGSTTQLFTDGFMSQLFTRHILFKSALSTTSRQQLLQDIYIYFEHEKMLMNFLSSMCSYVPKPGRT